MYIKSLLGTIIIAMFISAAAFAAETEHQHQHQHQSTTTTPLTAPGNGAFAAIQEVVEKLLADPDTDWSRVNLEALRQHLVDMQNFTFNVKVLKHQPIDNGVTFTVKATTSDAAGSLDRLFSAHPAILKQESGWDMTATKNKDGSYTAKIRGLGYIGLVAYGKHHQSHHWQMAIGSDPHHSH
jgi:hypothetical protein